VIKAAHPDFEYRPLFPPEELGDAGRVRWVSGTPGNSETVRNLLQGQSPQQSR
jgi:hypothetical protein